MAKRTMTLGQNGRIVFDYDMKIAEPFAASPTGEGVDLWPAFAALGTELKVIVRGKPAAAEVVATPFVATRYYRKPKA